MSRLPYDNQSGTRIHEIQETWCGLMARCGMPFRYRRFIRSDVTQQILSNSCESCGRTGSMRYASNRLFLLCGTDQTGLSNIHTPCCDTVNKYNCAPSYMLLGRPPIPTSAVRPQGSMTSDVQSATTAVYLRQFIISGWSVVKR